MAYGWVKTPAAGGFLSCPEEEEGCLEVVG